MAQQISDSELELMKIVWANGGTALYAHIMEELTRLGYTWQKNTVITLLSRLVEKGLLQTRTFLDKLYAGSAKGLVATLIQTDLLSAEDYAQLKSFWEEGRDGK